MLTILSFSLVTPLNVGTYFEAFLGTIQPKSWWSEVERGLRTCWGFDTSSRQITSLSLEILFLIEHYAAFHSYAMYERVAASHPFTNSRIVTC